MPHIGLSTNTEDANKVCLGVYVTYEMHKALSRTAVEQERTISAVVRLAIKEYIERYERDKYEKQKKNY